MALIFTKAASNRLSTGSKPLLKLELRKGSLLIATQSRLSFYIKSQKKEFY